MIETIKKAKARRNIDKPLILHSDRGSQYVSKEYKRVTATMQCSYSKKAYPWDNACMESFHSLIKREWLNRFKIRDYDHAYRLIFEYLEAFYNTKRIHSHCDYCHQTIMKSCIVGFSKTNCRWQVKMRKTSF